MKKAPYGISWATSGRQVGDRWETNEYKQKETGFPISYESQLVHLSVTTKVVCDTGYTVDGLRTQIEAAIEGYLLTLRKSWINTDSIIVRRAGLENAVYDIDGVIDVSSLTIDGANESGNKKMEENVIPVKGVIACS